MKCIYIDPPYNTGNEGWAYNDNVNSPEIRRWLGKVVDAEKLDRHDRWLCMMWPRLSLLKEFLTADGLIFVSIDDNEVTNLLALLNTLFLEPNRLEVFVWKKSYGGGAKETYAVTMHEYVACFARSREEASGFFEDASEKALARYKGRDQNFERLGPYRLKPLEATKSLDHRSNLIYDVRLKDGRVIRPIRQWIWKQERLLKGLESGLVVPVQNREGEWTFNYKQYMKGEDGEVKQAKPSSIIEGIYTQSGSGELSALVGDNAFPYPKPTALIQKLASFAVGADETAIVLDSFAGSGTTGHAVHLLNQRGGGLKAIYPRRDGPWDRARGHGRAASPRRRPVPLLHPR